MFYYIKDNKPRLYKEIFNEIKTPFGLQRLQRTHVKRAAWCFINWFLTIHKEDDLRTVVQKYLYVILLVASLILIF